jgi:DNA-binding protein H-NS
LATIEAKIAELQAKAEALKTAEKPGVKQLRDVLIKYRLTANDIAKAMNGSSEGRGNALKGTKVKPKYRNPADRSETWTGRGMRPRWMVAAMKGGKKIEDFLIK